MGSAAAATLFILLAPCAAAPRNAFRAACAEPDTARTVDMEVVVVTASPKENARLREQPVSSAVFTGGSIGALGVSAVKDLSGFVRNLYIPDYGSRLTSSVYIRGIGSRMNTPSVAMYVDNVPVADKSAYDFALFDIDRIDVLNGPQGTLYGRNSMGGLIRVFTADPMRRQGTKVSLGATGRVTGRRVSASVSRKPRDGFAYSAGGYWSTEEGCFRNASTGRKADGSREAGASLRAAHKPSGRLRLDLSAKYSYSDEDAYPYFYTGKAPSAEGEEAFPEQAGRIAANRRSKYRRSMLNCGAGVTCMMPRYTLSSVASCQFLQDRMYMDQDFLPADIYSLEQRQRILAASEELSLKTVAGRWKTATGLFAMYQHTHTATPVAFYGDGMAMLNAMVSSRLPKPTFTNPLTHQPVTVEMEMQLTDPFLTLTGDYRTPVVNLAAFHQSVFSDFPARGVDLTVGLRVDMERQKLGYDMTAGEVSYNFATTMTPPASLKARADLEGKHSCDYVQLLPKVALQYNFGNRGNVYATFSKGCRSGGYNIQSASELAQTQLRGSLTAGAKGYVTGLLQQQIDNAGSEVLRQMFAGIKSAVEQGMPEVSVPGAAVLRYKPEYSCNYEAGMHFSLPDNSLQIDAALFFTDMRDQQIARYSASGLGRQTMNAGRSHSCGAEFGMSGFACGRRLSFSASYGFTRAEFAEYNDGAEDFKGKCVPMTPAHNMSVSADYTLPVNSKALSAVTFGADVVGLGKIYWTERNDVSQRFYANVGAHMTAELGFARLRVWGKNLTCAKYDTFYFESMSRGFRQQGKPCRIGADLTFEF